MKVNLYTWHSERSLTFCPKHFVLVKTEITEESKLWIDEYLIGRYYIGSFKTKEPHDFLLSFSEFPYFEDPQEAIAYQLKWS